MRKIGLVFIVLLCASVAPTIYSTNVVSALPPSPAELSMVSPPTTWTFLTDFRWIDWTGITDVTAKVVFVGYGLTMPAPSTYDDYHGIDVKGKIVLVIRHGPNNDASWNVPIPGTTFTAWSFAYKAYNAFQHKAVGMILVNNDPSIPAYGYGSITQPGFIPTFGALWVDRVTVGGAILSNLAALQAQIDSTHKPASTSTGKTVHMVIRGVTVSIDIKPGSSPNQINLKSKENVPVALLTTPDFDTSYVDPTTVRFAGASPVCSAIQDVNGDGKMDILFQFNTQDLDLKSKSTQATLIGWDIWGHPFRGTDSIQIVKK